MGGNPRTFVGRYRKGLFDFVVDPVKVFAGPCDFDDVATGVCYGFQRFSAEFVIPLDIVVTV